MTRHPLSPVRRHRGFTRLDLLIEAVLIASLMGLLFPVMEQIDGAVRDSEPFVEMLRPTLIHQPIDEPRTQSVPAEPQPNTALQSHFVPAKGQRS